MDKTIPFPAPTPTPISQPFWDGAAEQELRFQRCRSCESAIFPPRAHCPRCWHADLTWEVSGGRGRLASRAVVHKPGHPAFAALAPFALALVDLDEGFRMLTRLVGPGADELPVEAPVQVRWEPQGDVTLPLFGTDDGELS
ncbi:hypothetical protein FE374_14365 [Georgenia yuyongxinii]|uniref:DNA-binding protein n=1 Tax=Georgenia yuyongxinii TaxID=2589797 RepID=A0A5B8C4X5_9MICO|nr:OB-fold domain-containing protein [Georgenia yuyongxinii]QDC25633.1 hypothetical protein FE374_14365 [Georgenia yuyongxinii]